MSGELRPPIPCSTGEEVINRGEANAKAFGEFLLADQSCRVGQSCSLDVSERQPRARVGIPVTDAVLRVSVGVVGSLVSEEKMVRTGARWVVAFMQDIHPIGNQPVVEFPGDAMGIERPPRWRPESSVSVLVCISTPPPAMAEFLIDRRTFDDDLAPVPLFDRPFLIERHAGARAEASAEFDARRRNLKWGAALGADDRYGHVDVPPCGGHCTQQTGGMRT